MRTFGLIGQSLTHSFSKDYFSKKFQKEGKDECEYLLFELESIEQLPHLIKSHSNLTGLNVTIPFKEQIIPYLDELDDTALSIGAVNVVKLLPNSKLKGYNTDCPAFRESLLQWIGEDLPNKAIVLGTGGASKAVTVALKDLNIEYQVVSRQKGSVELTYLDLQNKPNVLFSSPLIINTTPVGMYPDVDACPVLPYHLINQDHYLYDLIYNPERTLFLEYGQEQGALVTNGLEMLRIQAELSWEIWNNP